MDASLLLFFIGRDKSMQEVGPMGTCFKFVERDAAFETLAQTIIRFDASMSTCKQSGPVEMPQLRRLSE